jgi:peroxiredoxin
MAKKLTPGEKAPTFTTTDVHGDKIKLSTYKDSYVLLVFLRYAGCPYCNLAIHRLALEYKQLLDNDCQVIAFIQSSKENIEENYAKSITKIPYWLNSVREHGFKQAKVDGNLFLVPAYFLINGRTGTLVRTDYAKSFYEHRTFADIYQPLLFEKIDAVYGMIK